MASIPQELHSMRRLARDFDVDPMLVRGMVAAMGLRTYHGPRGGICVDDAGRAKLKAKLKQTGLAVA